MSYTWTEEAAGMANRRASHETPDLLPGGGTRTTAALRCVAL